ncbi:hypothetical protein ACGFH8_13560 [Micromonospora sp. NPDC049175]|uniref:hypothetical protein n=1 Tax=Micromonospora sp. NPDC049175 TaxID=3364266 RepID=UPI0037207DED
MGDGPVDEFERYIQDATVSVALREWAAGRDATVRPPCHATRRRGRSGAELIPVIVQRRDGRDAEQLYVKVLPAGQAIEEAARHAAAVAVDAGFAERHLVGQPYPRYPVGDGRYLMFQDIAHGAELVVPLAKVGDDQLKDAYRTLLDGVWNSWHRAGRRSGRTSVGEFVRRELADAGATSEVYTVAGALGLRDLDADWLLDPATNTVVPNPLRFGDGSSLFQGDPLDQLCGVSHGDLHGGNALFPSSGAWSVHVKRFCLVDTDRFAVDAPLTRDLVSLLLDAVLAELAAGTRTVQADALRTLLVDPRERPSDRLPPLPAKVIKASYAVGLAVARDGNWGVNWRAQYLLSLLSQALVCCTYEDAGRAGRAWYFRLAAHAALAYQREFRPDVVPPAAAGLVTVPVAVVDPQPAFPGNDRPARFDAVGAQPSQQNRPAPLDRAHLDQARRPSTPDAPPWRWGAVAIPQRQVPGGWHGTAPVGGRPGPATGTAASASVSSSASGRPPVRDGNRRANRSVPRHLVATRTNAIPRPRRPSGTNPPAPPAPPGRISRLPPKLLAVLVILLGGGVTLTSLVAVGAATVRGRGETPVAPTSEASPGTVPSPSNTSGYAGRAQRLADLALAVAGIAPSTADGAYTLSCLRVWAPADLAPGVDRNSYRDEHLWWSPALSGRRVVTTTTKGRRSGAPASFRYGQGDLTEVPPVPSVDPSELRRQLAAQLGELPPELRTAAGMVNVVSRVFRYHLLSPGQISALLFELAATPGIQDRGAYPDWGDRPGLAFSADAQDRRETVQFDPHTGELLSHATTTVTDNQTLDYVLFVRKERADRTTGNGCA